MALKTAVRSLGIGIFLAGAILSANQWVEDNKSTPTQKASKSVPKDSIVVKKDKIDSLEKKIATLEADNKKLKQNATQKETKKKEQVKKYTINVTAGMGTAEVSKLLKTEGIIKSSDDFEAYIINEGKSSSIQLGKTEVNEKMTEKELLKALTKRK